MTIKQLSTLRLYLKVRTPKGIEIMNDILIQTKTGTYSYGEVGLIENQKQEQNKE